MTARLFFCSILLLPSLILADSAERVGKPVRKFESPEDAYSLDLSGAGYTFIDFSGQVPEASFSAMQINPAVITLVIAEKTGVTFSQQQYAELVKVAMRERITNAPNIEFDSMSDLGETSNGELTGLQTAIRARTDGVDLNYVVTTTVNGSDSYQLLTFGTGASAAVILKEANTVWNGFALTTKEVATVPLRRVDNFESLTYGYRWRTDSSVWFPWTEFTETYPHADVAAATASGIGAVVMPFCWNGEKPPERAVISVVMQQFGEDYPSNGFIQTAEPLTRDGASGLQLFGVEKTGTAENEYLFRIVMNDRCAYGLGTWGEKKTRDLRKNFDAVWQSLEILDGATATASEFHSEKERSNNAYHLFGVGLSLYESKTFREAFRFLSQAAELNASEVTYLTYTLRSLTDIEAYQDAYDWLLPQLPRYGKDATVRSWDAWLAYQTNDADKALRVYRELFDEGHRDEEDFSVYMSLLADAEQWDELDRQFDAFAKSGLTESLAITKSKILSRRGQFDVALKVLDDMQSGRPYSAELAYQRVEVLQDMDNPAELLRTADELIEKGYRSLRSYYYKGSAEYQLQSFLKARESFEMARTYSPAHSGVQEYLDAINSVLGQDDQAAISNPIEALPLPPFVQAMLKMTDLSATAEGYGAIYLSQTVGYEFDGSEKLRTTDYRQIKILNDSGIRDFSALEFDFDPGYERLYVNSVTVRDAAGDVVGNGDPASYYITHAESAYEASNEQTVHIPVPSLAHGAVIEAVVTTVTNVEKGEFPLEQIYFSSERPVLNKVVFVSGEKDRLDELQYEAHMVAAPVRKNDAMIWAMQEPIVYRWEPLQPYYDQILPWLYVGTTATDWRSAGRDYIELIRDKLDTSKTASQAERLVADAASLDEKIAILSAFVQENVHYEAIEFGRRAQVPKTARETLRDRYGDCKDHAVLLYSMLNAVDVPAELALVNLSQKILPGLPGIDQFDHMIVAVQGEQGRRFIDPTDKDLHLGFLAPRSMAGNLALVLGEEPGLAPIPEYPTAGIGLVVQRSIEKDADGFLLITETGTFTDYLAAELRGQLRGIETSEMGVSMQRWVAARYKDAELTDFFVDNIFKPGNDLVIELQYRLPIESDGSFKMPGFFEAHYLDFDRVKDRRFSFQHGYPLRMTSTTALNLGSAGSLALAAEKPAKGTTKFGGWEKHIDRQADGWTISIDYSADLARFRPGDYREFTEFHRVLMNSIEQPLVLR